MKKKEIKHIDLKAIKGPDFLKSLSYDELNALSEDIRKEIILSTSKNGGHLSSNLGAVESTIALCKSFDFSKDKIIFDVGHQSYTYKILTGRNLETLRTKDGISGFQKQDESSYDHFSCGHSSTSIAAANGFAIARDLANENFNVISYIGDASITNGLAFEALNDNAIGKHKIIIVLNDNEMSISKPVGGLSKLFRKFSTSNLYIDSKKAYKKVVRLGKPFDKASTNVKNWIKRHLMKLNIFDTLGFSYIGPINGHDIKEMEKAFAKAKKIDRSVVIHLKTIKGKGYKYAEQDKDGSWHGVSPFNIETGKPLKEVSYTWSKGYADALLEEMHINDKIIAVVPGTSYGSYIDDIKKVYKNRVFDVGIAEEYALTMSAALSAGGFYPIISIYSTFLQRAYDQLSHDLARQNYNATILIDRAGLVGADGDTHQGIYDEAFLYSIPDISIAMASNSAQIKSLLSNSISNKGINVLRYTKESTNKNDDSEIVKYGDWKKLIEGSKTAIVSVGPDTELLKEQLIKQNKNVSLYNAIYLKPINENWIKELLYYNKLVIFDPYATQEGFASYLTMKLVENNFKGEIIVKCVPNKFVKQASIKEQKEEFKLSIQDIIQIL